MKTIEQEHVCPYAGLRSFTEEESLYFKGRDSQIEQLSDLLEENKFLMVTGASGEGKSSLIYAGLIPSMKAGFFKSHYTNWLVADFRPERNPLSNMASAIASALNTDDRTVETELRRGFSSLIDLYINSPYYIDENDSQWSGQSETQKKDAKRKAANLVVIIDQFEEFFTNPENFSNDAPSSDSQIVVNLALETARIALKRRLPVYVVFTMRSDFIGQCTAFRGLPEYIGFSQFFVPRLKRKDFKQVIEEPAVLSGNQISQRLIERLVYDIADGVDQLPVLQHALNQVWLAALNGEEEMDLVHYAMAGGMPPAELPDDDQGRFQAWLKGLPDFKKVLLHETGLQRIIELHANKLYEEAWAQYIEHHPEKPITIVQCKRTIAMAFICLTKIDNSRAVRNRMTLREITNIINDPQIDSEIVSNVLSIFREEGNSFIRPYKTADPASHLLAPDTVLDITHEALIRNWGKLNTWAVKEFEYYSTWLDFKKQLIRWKESGKRNGYLLPIGPLTYFETWYNNTRPNASWIKRYLDEDHETASAEDLLADTRDYLRRSARKVMVSRAFIKYGTRRVVVFLSILLMLVLSGFYWNDAENKRNKNVIDDITTKAESLLASKEVGIDSKTYYLLVAERYRPGTIMEFLESQTDQKERLSISINVYERALRVDNHFNLPVKRQLTEFVDKELLKIAKAGNEDAFLLRQANRYVVTLTFDNYYNPFAEAEKEIVGLTRLQRDIAMNFFKHPDRYEASVTTEINFALQYWLALGQPTTTEIEETLAVMSPDQGGAVFNVFYPKGVQEFNGNRSLDYNGGYHVLASLYAATGNEQKVIASFEKIKELGDYFFAAGTSGRLFNNYNNVIGYLYQYGHEEKIAPVIKWITANFPSSSPQAIYKNIINRSGYLTRIYFMNITRATRSHRGYLSPNLYLTSRDQLEKMASDYEDILKTLPNQAEKNFLLAMQYKRMAMFESKYCFDRGIQPDTAKLNGLLDKAWDHFGLTDAAYLEQVATPLQLPYWSDGVRQPKIANRQLFIYPDYMDGWFSRTYHTDLFFTYMEKNGLLEKNFNSPGDLYYIHFWLAKAYEWEPFRDSKFHNFFTLSDQTLISVADLLTRKGSEANLSLMLLANRAFDRGDTSRGMAFYHKLAFNQIRQSSSKFDYLEKTFFINQMKDLSRNLAGHGYQKEAGAIINLFEYDREKAFSYIFNAERIFATTRDPVALTYLDSALTLMNREDFNALRWELNYRIKLITVLSQVGGDDLKVIAQSILGDFFEGDKFDGILSTVQGAGADGSYYFAKSTMPSTLTESQELDCYGTLLWAVTKANAGNDDSWKFLDEYLGRDQEYIYYVPF